MVRKPNPWRGYRGGLGLFIFDARYLNRLSEKESAMALLFSRDFYTPIYDRD